MEKAIVCCGQAGLGTLGGKNLLQELDPLGAPVTVMAPSRSPIDADVHRIGGRSSLKSEQLGSPRECADQQRRHAVLRAEAAGPIQRPLRIHSRRADISRDYEASMPLRNVSKKGSDLAVRPADSTGDPATGSQVGPDRSQQALRFKSRSNFLARNAAKSGATENK